jgi:hypothetical protein
MRSAPGEEAEPGERMSDPKAEGVRFRFEMMEDVRGTDMLLVVE